MHYDIYIKIDSKLTKYRSNLVLDSKCQKEVLIRVESTLAVPLRVNNKNTRTKMNIDLEDCKQFCMLNEFISCKAIKYIAQSKQCIMYDEVFTEERILNPTASSCENYVKSCGK